MIKQIAGRAGRRNSEFAQGKVTCKNPEELGILTAALEVRVVHGNNPVESGVDL